MRRKQQGTKILRENKCHIVGKYIIYNNSLHFTVATNIYNTTLSCYKISIKKIIERLIPLLNLVEQKKLINQNDPNLHEP